MTFAAGVLRMKDGKEIGGKTIVETSTANWKATLYMVSRSMNKIP